MEPREDDRGFDKNFFAISLHFDFICVSAPRKRKAIFPSLGLRNFRIFAKTYFHGSIAVPSVMREVAVVASLFFK